MNTMVLSVQQRYLILHISNSIHLINYTIIPYRTCLSIGTPVHSIGAPQYYYYYD